MADPSGGRIEPIDPASTHPAIRPAFDAARARGIGLNLQRIVAHAPSLLAPFLNLSAALQAAPGTPRADRELVVLRTAQLCDSDYVTAHHADAAEAAGLGPDRQHELAGWLDSPRFTERQRAILAFVDGMFGPEGVRDSVYTALARLLSPEEIVEVALTAAFYGGVARFADALRVPLEPHAPESRDATR